MTQPDVQDSPPDPAGYRPRRLLGVGFWAMLAFALLCVLAGIAIADFGPKLLANVTVGPAPAGAPAPAEPAAAPPPPAPPPEDQARAPLADVSRLDARVAALEAGEQRTAQAAAAALAAAAVVEVTQTSGPFTEEIASLRAVSAPSAELNALAHLAEAGAPSRAALAASFPDYAARAASAAQAPGDHADLGARIVYALSRVVTLRRVGEVPGGDADAVLARAERLVDDGDLDRALRLLDKLPPGAREALAPWRVRAERRAEIDRNAQALRVRALETLTALPRAGA